MLNGIRLRAAERLLLRGVPIALAAVDTGFTDQSHLTRRFKGSLGITPAKWLRAARRS
jgi:AraC-like DNA-binding protein